MRRVRTALVAATLLLAACGGGDDDKVSSEGGDDAITAVEPDATTSTVAEGSSDTVVAAGGTSPTAPGPSTASAGSAGTGSAPAADGAPQPPAPGAYRYHVTGSSKLGAGPAQPMDMVSTTQVEHLGSGMVRQTSEDQVAVTQWTGSAILLHSLDLTRSGFERHFEAEPPVQYAPIPLAPGQQWGWSLTATDKPTTVRQDSRVDRLETITVNGAAVQAVVVVTRITLSGDVSGTIDLTQWVDTADGLPKRTHAVTNIVTFAYSSDTTADFIGFAAA